MSVHRAKAGTRSSFRNAHSYSKTAAIAHPKPWSTLREVYALLNGINRSSTVDEEEVFQHVRFHEKQRVFTVGQPFEMLYIVNGGFLKTVMFDRSGHEQVLSFLMKGDLFGVDGIHGKRYASEAVALSDCDIILIPFTKLIALGHVNPWIGAAVYSAISRELNRERKMVSVMALLTAEMRVARFLVWLADRYSETGLSSTQLHLQMSRNDIGSYLGLALETVSRVLSAFNDMGLISVDARAIVIHDLHALKSMRRLPTYYPRKRKNR